MNPRKITLAAVLSGLTLAAMAAPKLTDGTRREDAATIVVLKGKGPGKLLPIPSPTPTPSPTPLPAPSGTVGYVLDGDSITEGPNYLQVLPRSEQLAALTGLSVTNLGVSGRTLATMDATFASRGVAALYDPASRNTLILLGGINDIMNAGATLASLQASMTSYAAKVRGTGFRFVIGTLLPVAKLDTNKEKVRSEFNDWLRLNYKALGAMSVVDYAALPEAASPEDQSYYLDGLHPTPRLLNLMTLADIADTGQKVIQYIGNPYFTPVANVGGWTGVSYTNGYTIGVNSSVLTYQNGSMRIAAASDKIYPEANTVVQGLIIGRRYRVTWQLVGNSSQDSATGARLSVKDSVNAGFLSGANRNDDTGVKSVLGTYSTVFTAGQTMQAIIIQRFGESGYVDVDNIQIAEG